MFRTRIAVLVALAAAMLGGTAGAAAAATEARPNPAFASAVAKEVARFKAAGLQRIALPPSKWVTDTGTDRSWNGGCSASTHAEYYPANDQAVMSTTVGTPYWWAACRANAQLWIETRAGSFAGASNYSMGCGVWDPTCASTQTRTGDYRGDTRALTAYVDSVNDGLEAAGLARTYTRAWAVTGIRVTHGNAG